MATDFKMLSQVAISKDFEMEERMRRIVNLSCRRDRILEASILDLEGLAILTADYEMAHLPRAAADLRKRSAYYQEREVVEVW